MQAIGIDTMHFGSLPAGWVAFALMCALASGVRAGPIALEEARTAIEPAAEAKLEGAGDATAGTSTRAVTSTGAAPESGAGAAASRRARAEGAEPGAGGGAAPRELRTGPAPQSTGTGAAAERLANVLPTDARRSSVPPRTPTTQGAPADDDGLTIKAVASTAKAWINENMPWVRGQDDADKPAVNAGPPAEGSEFAAELGLDAGSSFDLRGERGAAQPGTATGERDVTFSGSSADRIERGRLAERGGENWLKEAVRFGRDLVEHPLTWIVLVLVGLVHVALSRAGRGK
jgi:hypothetical protein